MKKTLYILVPLFLLSTLLIGCTQQAISSVPAAAPTTKSAPPAASPAAPKAAAVTFKAVTYKTIQDPMMIMIHWLKEKVEKKSNGQIAINIIGGPETLGEQQQIEAMRTSVVDIIVTSPGYGETLVGLTPSTVIKICRDNPAKQRETGFWDLLNDIYRPYNIMNLATVGYPGSRFLQMTKPVYTLAEMKGKRIRVSGFAETELIKALGGQALTPPWGDTYGAMEKGALDGFYGAYTSATGYSFQEVAKFACGPPVNEQALKAVWMRLDAFTKLPQNLQTVMIEAAREIEVQYMAVNEKEVEDSKKICLAAGMKIIDFSAEESAKYRQMFNDISWEAVKKDRPELLPKLKQLIEGTK